MGSLTSLSNTSGALASSYTYDSFGDLVAFSGSIVNTFRYTGREFDAETGLYYYRARYYDPTSGRFISEDRMGLKEGLDLYAYVSNNPVTNADPSGRFKIDQSCKKPQCRTFGSAGQQNVEQVIQQQADFACQNLQIITDPKLRSCIQKSCDKGTIKCKDNSEKGCKDAGGYNNKFLFFTNRTANLCPGNWPDWTPLSYVGDAVIHEFAHGCGWDHGQGGGVPVDPGKGK